MVGIIVVLFVFFSCSDFILPLIDWVGFNGMSTLVGHFVSSPREREEIVEREEIIEEMKERDRGERGK